VACTAARASPHVARHVDRQKTLRRACAD
jgi:hypothetical protein